MKLKKSLGQNFLTSVGAVNKIVATAVETVRGLASHSEITILEIGPGRGVLTEALLRNFKKVIAIEKDDDLFEGLREKFRQEIKNKQLDLVHGDILELTPEKLELSSKQRFDLLKEIEPLSENRRVYGVVANIPYYITGQFLRNYLEGTESPPKFMVLMLQKEVAKRIVAQDKKENLLSISVKAYGEPKYIETVKRGSFYPIPKVDSAILLIKNISKQRFDLQGEVEPPENSRVKTGEVGPRTNYEKEFFDILRAGFAHKRKFLIKNLESGQMQSDEKLEDTFRKCNIPPKARAEDLKLEDWLCLSTKLAIKLEDKQD